jgi:hypothetical protein
VELAWIDYFQNAVGPSEQRKEGLVLEARLSRRGLLSAG